MLPKEKILKEKKIKSIRRFGTVRTKVFISTKTGSKSLISGTTLIPQSKSINLHYHNCEEAVLIMEGTAVAEINYKKYILNAGDVSWIPAKIPHRFINKKKTKLKNILDLRKFTCDTHRCNHRKNLQNYR